MNNLRLIVRNIIPLSSSVRGYELFQQGGQPLPAFEAGAHISFDLENGMTRSYSLVNSQQETGRYVVAVALDPNSRGGSSYIHENWTAGTTVNASLPRNNFPLILDAEHYVLVAGGIGITPIRSMLLHLESLSRSWELHFSSRSRSVAAFVDEMKAYGARVHIYYDDDTESPRMQLGALFAARSESTRFYCCGPSGLLEAFQLVAGANDCDERAHIERFNAEEAVSSEGNFVVRLARSGTIVPVKPGLTILQALREQGIEIPSLCEQGVCGSCETRVLSGLPDHRDAVLTKKQRSSNSVMMICCSGSLTPEIELDL